MATANSNSDTFGQTANRVGEFILGLFDFLPLNPVPPTGAGGDNLADLLGYTGTNDFSSLKDALLHGTVTGVARDSAGNKASLGVLKAGGTAEAAKRAKDEVLAYIDSQNVKNAAQSLFPDISFPSPSGSNVSLYLIVAAVILLGVILFLPGRRR